MDSDTAKLKIQIRIISTNLMFLSKIKIFFNAFLFLFSAAVFSLCVTFKR